MMNLERSARDLEESYTQLALARPKQGHDRSVSERLDRRLPGHARRGGLRRRDRRLRRAAPPGPAHHVSGGDQQNVGRARGPLTEGTRAARGARYQEGEG